MTTNNKFRTGFLSEMRRYPGEGWISGVCAGIADYFDWKPKVVRLIVALLAIFTAGWVVFVIYCLLWYVMDNGDEMPGPHPKWNDGSPGPSAPYFGPSGGSAASASVDLRDIKERFSRLDERLRRMEETALSKDDDLKREIEKLERDGKA